MTTHGATAYERLLFEDLKEETDLGLRRVAISEAEDPFGDAVWHILLLLDPPSGPAGSWDPVATGALKATARKKFDALTATVGDTRPGLTTVAISAYEPDDSDLALPDVPEPDERTDVDDEEPDA